MSCSLNAPKYDPDEVALPRPQITHEPDKATCWGIYQDGRVHICSPFSKSPVELQRDEAVRLARMILACDCALAAHDAQGAAT